MKRWGGADREELGPLRFGLKRPGGPRGHSLAPGTLRGSFGDDGSFYCGNYNVITSTGLLLQLDWILPEVRNRISGPETIQHLRHCTDSVSGTSPYSRLESGASVQHLGNNIS